MDVNAKMGTNVPPLHRTDCRHFHPDRPCAPHKDLGVVCDGCGSFEKAEPRLLVLKTAALGDVLRSLSVLPALRAEHPRAHVTWVARAEAFPLFEGVPGVDRLLPYSWETFLRLRRESFDLLWSLDFDPAVAAWAAEVPAAVRRGFVFQDGRLTALHPEAAGWVDMSLDDGLKRRNRRTYQSWMFDVCGLDGADRHLPAWTVSPEEAAWARDAARRWRLPARNRVVGLNTGAGRRWAQKSWPEERWADLLRLLRREKGLSVLLLGGPEEAERNRRLKKAFPWTVDTGVDNPLRRFGAVVSLCGAVVTGDTLAMHVAVALKKHVVALFGATSAAEIELYGRGEKLHKDWDCLPCYRPVCVRSPHCMDALAADEVLASLRRQLRG
jgi:heptosyltransferase-2